jgi:DNA polymerase I-like protein with 3'-5' exonuclease and polymerase domains
MALIPIGIDFEFRKPNEKYLDLVCCVLGENKYWLYDKTDTQILINKLKSIQKTHILLAYYAPAESRSLISLGLNPIEFNWIDLYAEFKMLQNSNNKFKFGAYIDEDGTIKHSIPYVKDNKKDKKNHKLVPSNLINCAYKLIGERLDAVEKDEVRGIIINKPELIEINKERIMEYCFSDTKHLNSIYDKMLYIHKKESLESPKDFMLQRGEYSSAMGIVESNGMCINIPLLNKIIEKTPDILLNKTVDVQQHFPYFTYEHTPIKFLKSGELRHNKTREFKKDTKALQSFIEQLQIKEWPKTENGAFITSSEEIEEFKFIPAIQELLNYNRLDSCLKWFKPNNKEGFLKSIGSDNYCRPFFGIFGTQTGRNAAKAKTFPLAMSSWLRTIVKAPENKYLIASDFSQQEIYVAAILSGDDNLLKAYNSGDVYLEFAKQAGLVPKDATKTSHKRERNLCKAIVLG